MIPTLGRLWRFYAVTFLSDQMVEAYTIGFLHYMKATLQEAFTGKSVMHWAPAQFPP